MVKFLIKHIYLKKSFFVIKSDMLDVIKLQIIKYQFKNKIPNYLIEIIAIKRFFNVNMYSFKTPLFILFM